jgi:hypothetical protein
VSENKVLRGISGTKRDEVAGDWRRLHNEELHNLYASPHITRVIKSRRARWAGNIARIGIVSENLEEKGRLGDIGVDGRILKWFLSRM